MKKPVHTLLRILAVVFALSLLAGYAVYVQRQANPALPVALSSEDEAMQTVAYDSKGRPRTIILGTKSMNGAIPMDSKSESQPAHIEYDPLEVRGAFKPLETLKKASPAPVMPSSKVGRVFDAVLVAPNKQNSHPQIKTLDHKGNHQVFMYSTKSPQIKPLLLVEGFLEHLRKPALPGLPEIEIGNAYEPVKPPTRLSEFSGSTKSMPVNATPVLMDLLEQSLRSSSSTSTITDTSAKNLAPTEKP